MAAVLAIPLFRGAARCGASLGRECHEQSARYERGRVCTATTMRYRQAEQEDAEEGEASNSRGRCCPAPSDADNRRMAGVSSIAGGDRSRASARLDPSNTAQRGTPSAKHQAPSTKHWQLDGTVLREKVWRNIDRLPTADSAMRVRVAVLRSMQISCVTSIVPCCVACTSTRPCSIGLVSRYSGHRS